MDYKTFRTVQMVVAFVFGMLVAVSVVLDNIVLAVVSAAAMLAVVLLLKKKVRGVISDERDYANAGKAARMAVSIFSSVGAITALVLLFMHYEVIGSIVADAVCALMLIHTGFYMYYEKQH